MHKKLAFLNLYYRIFKFQNSKLKIKENEIKRFKFILLLIFLLIIFSNKYFIIFRNNEFFITNKYYRLCNKGILLKKKKYSKNIKPKISIIAAIYNKRQFIIRFIRSIQNQNFNNIEIILVDDCSTDNSVKIIEKYQKNDERIILIKHHRNKGTLISRNNGIIKAKGEYVIIPDPDDILLNNILNISYIYAKKNDYDIIRFDAKIGNYELYMKDLIKNIKDRPIYQPELSLLIFYGEGYLEQLDYVLWNKLIKRKIFIKTLNSIKEYYLNQNMITFEDGLINFILYKEAKSFYYLEYIGYYYLGNKFSITSNYKNNNIFEKLLFNNFLYLKFIFQYTRNTKYEKNIFSLIFNKMPKEFYDNKSYKKINKKFDFYYEIINSIINSELVPLSVKNKLFSIKNLIKISQNISNIK